MKEQITESWERQLIDFRAVTAAEPILVSDVLYLMAADHPGASGSVRSPQVEAAVVRSIRGDIRGALSLISAIPEPAVGTAYADHLNALRTFWGAPDRQVSAWSVDLMPDVRDTPASDAALLSVSSNHEWYSGNLGRGLALSRSAVDRAHAAPAVWQVYCALFLAKQLSDIHASHQALRIVEQMEELVQRHALYAIEPIPLALRALLHLQVGEVEEAVNSALVTLRTAERRGTTIGVKLALSVAATALIRCGDTAAAAAALDTFDSVVSDYILPDSIARAAFARLALLAQRDVAAAAERARSDWALLGTEAAFLVEDTARPAWLIGVARQAGDNTLADNSFQAIAKLAETNPDVPAVMLALEHARKAFDGKVSDEAPAAVDQAAGRIARLHAVDPGLPTVTSEAREKMSSRELEIARLVACGMTNRQVAKQLELSPHTVNFHLRKVFRKLRISTRAELAHVMGLWVQAGGIAG